MAFRYLSVFVLILSFLQAKSVDESEPYVDLSLNEALTLANEQNLEIDIAEFDKKIAALGVKVANGYNFGKIDATLMGLRSNDAGNVFGFKLQSREATFGDFGFSEFLGGVGEAIGMSGGDFAAFSNIMSDPQMAGKLLSTAPKDLNYPDARNHFDLKLAFMIPIYTGDKLINYKKIAKDMLKMSTFDKEKVIAQKSFEIRKTYYDISLLDKFVRDLGTIEGNIVRLRDATIEFKKEGYAKKTDLLEVESKLSNVRRMLFQAKANRELSYDFLSFLLNHEVKSIRHVSLDTFEKDIPLEEVLKRNKDIQKAKTGLDIRSKMVAVAKSAFKPTVGAFVEYGSSDNTFLGNFKDHDRYTLGVQAKLNLFNGGVDMNKLQQQKLKRLKVKKQVELAKKGITLQYKKIKTEINNANVQIKSLKKELELAQQIYDNYQERYKEGLASINDVVIKQSLQIEKLLKLLKAQNVRNHKILEVYRLAY